MFNLPSFDLQARTETVGAGQLLRQRHLHPDSVLYLEQGQVVLGIHEQGQMRHQLGLIQGPGWLDAAFVLTGTSCCMDMQTASPVRLRRISRAEFEGGLRELSEPTLGLLRDMAHGYCQQTETAVSRLAQDARVRCAQWLLRHARQDRDGQLRVTLQQRKRLIAAQLGIAPETLSRVLRQLRELGLIAGQRNELCLPLPGALHHLAAGETAR